jgi:cytochrome d ubiquinol oxidase subunit I
LTAAQAASDVPAKNIALTLALYLSLYAALLLAYVRVVFHLASKPAQTRQPLRATGMSPTVTDATQAGAT